MSVIDDASRLRHIIQAADQAVEFVKGVRRSDLDDDVKLGLALVRLLEIVGEAALGISESMKSKYPEVPWRQMTSMRNRLIHGYFDVNHDRVWDTIIEDLPPLITKLKRIIKDEQG